MTIFYEGDQSHCGLPKWPAMVVIGKPVTREQAAEIIIKTDVHIPDIWGNDKGYARQVSELFGIPQDRFRYPGPNASEEEQDAHRRATRRRFNALDRLRDELGCIPLEYLNHDRILSSYIGGTNGWCNWNGQIGIRDKNIGKWPEVDIVAQEWQRILDAFPFLDLRCQLFSGEQCEEHSRPVVHYIVRNGDVTVRPSNGMVLTEPEELNMESTVAALFSGRFGGATDLSISALREKLEMIYGTIPQYEGRVEDE